MKELAKRIYEFLEKYARISPNWDGEIDEEKYSSPDASQMRYCADMLSKEIKPLQCWSEWGSGGYQPYSSKLGAKEHDELVEEIYEIINKKI